MVLCAGMAWLALPEGSQTLFMCSLPSTGCQLLYPRLRLTVQIWACPPASEQAVQHQRASAPHAQHLSPLLLLQSRVARGASSLLSVLVRAGLLQSLFPKPSRPRCPHAPSDSLPRLAATCPLCCCLIP